MHASLRDFLRLLRQRGEIVDVECSVDPTLELPEIHRRVIAEEGPALFFRHVKGSQFPVVTNLFGTEERVRLAFGDEPQQVIAELIDFATRDFPPRLPDLWHKRHLIKTLLKIGTKKRAAGPVTQVCAPPDLEALPLLKTWPMDGGHFITLPLVYTQSPNGDPPNLGMYRIQRYDKQTAGLHFQIGKGGGFHLYQAEQKNEPLPVTIFLGGPPALIMSAITPLPENVPELLLCSFLQREKLALTKENLVSTCEFALVGEARPHERRPEGPFGDHYGYYSLTHDFPVFHCQKMYHRKDAIYPATVVGKPRQEDFYLGNYLQRMLSPLFPVVMPGVKAVWSYGETGFHSLSAAIVKERFGRECMTSAFRILGEGQLSLTKFLLLTDQPVDLENFRETLTTVLARFKPQTDLFIFANLSLDTLDYTGPELNKGSRGVLVGVGEPIRKLPETAPCAGTVAYCPGCLVVDPEKHPDITRFSDWPLIILVDDVEKATMNDETFLWTVFTRFEPAADISAGATSVQRHHLCYELPIIIDARMKPSYPPEVECDPDTERLVSENWNRYFSRK